MPVLSPVLERICVILPSWVGDCVMATPALRALHLHCPAATLSLACRPGLDSLLTGLPFPHVFISPPNSKFLGPFRLASAIRAAAPQASILLPNSFRSALCARLARTPIRAGYSRDSRAFLLTHPVSPPAQSPPRPVPAIDYYLNLVSALTSSSCTDRRMSLSITHAESQSSAPILASVPQPFIAFCLGANNPRKRWPAASFARLADLLLESRLAQAILLVGSPPEIPIAQQFLAALRPAAAPLVINTVGKLASLADLKPILAAASLLVSNDTGPRHIALALDTPVVSIFGPTDHRWTTSYSPIEHIILSEPFLPENLIADRRPAVCNIDRIPVADVFFAARRLLNLHPSA